MTDQSSPAFDSLRRQFKVHLADDGKHSRPIEGISFEDAAIGFIDAWSPAGDPEGDVQLVVVDCASGEQQCLRVDLDTGETEPCD